MINNKTHNQIYKLYIKILNKQLKRRYYWIIQKYYDDCLSFAHKKYVKIIENFDNKKGNLEKYLYGSIKNTISAYLSYHFRKKQIKNTVSLEFLDKDEKDIFYLGEEKKYSLEVKQKKHKEIIKEEYKELHNKLLSILSPLERVIYLALVECAATNDSYIRLLESNGISYKITDNTFARIKQKAKKLQNGFYETHEKSKFYKEKEGVLNKHQ